MKGTIPRVGALTYGVLILTLAGSMLSLDGCAGSSNTEDSIRADVGAKQEQSDSGSAVESRPQSGGVVQAPREPVSPASDSPPNIKVYFKLDPRLTRGTYMGERWVSPSTYASTQQGRQFTVEARARGMDAWGRSKDIIPQWTSTDPDMVTISPRQGRQVTITVLRPGQSNLEVTAPGFYRKLHVKASYQNSAIQVEFSRMK